MYWAMLVLLLAACSEPSVSHAPELGAYAFHAEWNHPDFPGDPATAAGELAITFAAEDEIHFDLTIDAKTHSGSAIFSSANGWGPLSSESVFRAGTWVLLPFLRRDGNSYQCRGNAFSGQHGGQTMTCSFNYLGP